MKPKRTIAAKNATRPEEGKGGEGEKEKTIQKVNEPKESGLEMI